MALVGGGVCGGGVAELGKSGSEGGVLGSGEAHGAKRG